ncbi:phage scaffolding protein [Staphylococcus saprophyticus]|nr:phage scaffolding protein [Staphylococcus saprophyticus]MDW4212553.1 phage scaffolding protein [Staphylococcus saprophyticus]MDW4227562.1 phage scaffolding protein [Staphylococcus saprophyticus]MDW4281729.1 phage scaffolding protein [Staphylococcus saprophyticus]MDW4362599.1 phage scaffolding protein [Staphylococcus saprophyticus]
MKREFLRNLGLDDEIIKKIIDKHHDSLQESKDNINSIKKELDKANEEISKRDKQITDLESKANDKEALEKQLEEYKNTNAEYESKMKELRLDNAIKVAVAKDAVNADHVLKLIDKEGLELQDDGTVKGLDKRLESFKEENTHLFGADKPRGNSPLVGANPESEKLTEQWTEFLK